jgi:hypothetical protein
MADKEYKWWLRYVLIPLVGSGGLVALLAILISRPDQKKSELPNTQHVENTRRTRGNVEDKPSETPPRAASEAIPATSRIPSTETVCPTETERKCEGIVYASHKEPASPVGCDIVVYTSEHKVPNSVYFIDVTANGRRFPRCTGPAPDYFMIMDQCPFEFNGKKWYATLETVRNLGNDSYDASIRLRRDCQ